LRSCVLLGHELQLAAEEAALIAGKLK
jgi:hypothetical protein